MSARFAAVALMLGNVVTALSILGPAGMLADLATGLSVSIREAGLLVTSGAVVLCFGSPLMTWAASAMDRRGLLAGTIAIVSLGLLATAWAPDYLSVLVLRIAMLVIGAVFTPMAASTIAMIVTEKERPGAISFVFLGWALAIAAGLPVITFLAAHAGWRAVYALLGAIGVLSALLIYVALPRRLRGEPLSMSSWGIIARHRFVCWLLLVTVLWTCGQFVLFPYLGPLLARLAGGTTQVIGASFAAMGIMGFLGNLTASRTVGHFGAWRMSIVFSASMFIGTALWAIGTGVLPAMVTGVALWGFGFAALNSMQQARLVATAPPLAGATVALNTSSNYVGQGIGSALGAEMFARDYLIAMGFVATAFMLLALFGVILSRRLDSSRAVF
ncbi:MAG TPA: MFS transporter [Xanthobacteraceae bacterium]|nr:MFS transporter [Xanthobacteraceae bacterium]